MTTIFCDKSRMIADMLTSANHTFKRSVDGKLTNFVYPVTSVDSVKIHQPTHLWYKDLKIKAMGFAGSLFMINPLVELFSRKPRGNGFEPDKLEIRYLLDMLTLFPQLKEVTVSGLFLCEDGTMLRMSMLAYTGPGAGPPFKIVECKEPINSVGTGGKYYEAEKKFQIEQPDVLDVFSFCVHKDPGSSYEFCMYSLETDKLEKKLMLTPKALFKNIDDFNACHDFTIMAKPTPLKLKPPLGE